MNYVLWAVTLLFSITAFAQGVIMGPPTTFQWIEQPRQIKVAPRARCAEAYICFGRANAVQDTDGKIINTQSIGCWGTKGACPSAQTCFSQKDGLAYIGPLSMTTPEGIDSPKGKDLKWASTPEQFLIKKSEACGELGICYGKVAPKQGGGKAQYAACPATKVNQCVSPDDCNKSGDGLDDAGTVEKAVSAVGKGASTGLSEAPAAGR